MLMRLLCRKTIQKETPNSPMNGGWGVDVSKTLFYIKSAEKNKCLFIVDKKKVLCYTKICFRAI